MPRIEKKNTNKEDNEPLMMVNDYNIGIQTDNEGNNKNDYHHFNDLSININSDNNNRNNNHNNKDQDKEEEDNDSIKININSNNNNNNNNNNNCNSIHHKYYHNKFGIDGDYDCCANIELFVDLMLSENEYILSGFRLHTKNSYRECTKSIFKLHNDTLNIWSHLLGALFYLGLFFNSIIKIIKVKYNQDNVLLNNDEISLLGTIDLPSNFNYLFFQFSCFICFLSSTIYHTYRSHSLIVFKTTLMLDVASIALLILSSVCLIIDAELSCWPYFKRVYLFSFLFLIFISFLSLPKIMREKRYGLRTLLFSILALQGLVGHLFKIYLQGYFDKDPNQLYSLICAYTLFGLALSIRRFKVPESFRPGHFDVWFSSHQIFHVLVVFGTFQLIEAYSYIYLNKFDNVGYVKQCLGF
ncbi:hypothetical protein ACTFIV_006828 [Dictyostelium citrinum]